MKGPNARAGQGGEPPGNWLSGPCERMLVGMSVADSLRAEQAERLRRLDVTARVELAFALGRRDLALYAATHAVTEAEARIRLRARRRTGRVHSTSAGA